MQRSLLPKTDLKVNAYFNANVGKTLLPAVVRGTRISTYYETNH